MLDSIELELDVNELNLNLKLNFKLNMLVMIIQLSHAESSCAAYYVTSMPQKKICKISGPRPRRPRLCRSAAMIQV